MRRVGFGTGLIRAASWPFATISNGRGLTAGGRPQGLCCPPRLYAAGQAAAAGTEDSRAPAERLAGEFSHPRWMVERWLERYGPEETRALLQWNNTRPRLVLQPARESLPALEARWRPAGIAVEPAPYGAGLVTDLR